MTTITRPPLTAGGDLQRIVDKLAQGTGRAVAVQDRAGRMLAYSVHQPDVDEIRKQAILTKRGPREGLAWARTFGIEEAVAPVRVPANEQLGMDARVCAPIRHDGKALGFVWLLDRDASLTASELEMIGSAADSAALSIHHEQLMEELERSRERELLRDLLSEQPPVRAHAIEELVEDGAFLPSEEVVCLVARPVRNRLGAGAHDRAVRSALDRALGQARANLPPRQAIQLLRPGHGLLLTTFRSATRPAGGPAEEAAEHLRTLLAAALPAGWKSVVGIGDARPTLDEARISYRHARQAAEVCGAIESFSPVTGWWQLGAYQTLLELPLETLTRESLHPGLGKLLETRDATVWLSTLERYLDLGCDARAAAKMLKVQRGSLYHRLHRIERLAAVDLSRGDDRLALHMGLKLARLAGLLDLPVADLAEGGDDA